MSAMVAELKMYKEQVAAYKSDIEDLAVAREALKKKYFSKMQEHRRSQLSDSLDLGEEQEEVEQQQQQQ